MRERRTRDRLGEGRQMVRQPHQLQRVDDSRLRGEVTDPGAGQCERLAHRPCHHQPRRCGQQRERAGDPGPPELRVCLIHDDHAGTRLADGITCGGHHIGRQRGAGGVVR